MAEPNKETVVGVREVALLFVGRLDGRSRSEAEEQEEDQEEEKCGCLVRKGNFARFFLFFAFYFFLGDGFESGTNRKTSHHD